MCQDLSQQVFVVNDIARPQPEVSLAAGSAAKLDTTNTPPCCHNRWSLQIRKKRYYIFECMQCSALWKTKLTGSQKCLDFFAGHCPNGDSCKYPHIYSKRALNCNREESSLELFRSSGVQIGGCSLGVSQPTDLQLLLDTIFQQQLSEGQDYSTESTSCSISDAGSMSSSCNMSE
eukprot:TRINITY_DN13041_c2_g1_i1.p1 TRINITY_DN13041_c2_g1~~TRINITY_DN13041_c2_g1_i1.p1  ORF type:complete len:175 (+),score=29.33 TRINITY_DN13041_c2_g1_i1:63-587(+)